MIRQSTALANFIASGGSYKEAFHDCIMAIYQGSQPTSADNTPNALLLNVLTYQGGTWSASTGQKDQVVITAGNTGDSHKVVINGTTYTRVQAANDTAATIAAALAISMKNDANVRSVSVGGTLVIWSRWEGVSYTIANTGSTTPGNDVITNITANSRGNGLHFGATTAGVLSKEAGVWSGVGVATGNAGWARLKSGVDNDSEDGTNSQFIRMDMNISTINADIIALSSLSVVTGVTQTCDTFNIIVPQS